MSYDLILESDHPTTSSRKIALDRIDSIPHIAEVEVVRGRGKRLATICFSAGVTDQVVHEVYAGLVSLARVSRHRLHDPQSGADIDLHDPGDYPTMLPPKAAVRPAAEPYMVGPSEKGWSIIAGQAGKVGHLYTDADGDLQLEFVAGQSAVIPVSWLLRQIKWLKS